MRLFFLVTLVLYFSSISKAQSFIHGPYLNKSIGLPLVADFTGDGKPDVIGSSRNFSFIGDLTLYKNLSETDSIIFESSKLGMKIWGDPGYGDFDGDGDMDLVIAESEDTTILVLLNNGNGTFTSHPQVAEAAYDFRSADLDGDDDIDVVAFNILDYSAYLMINDGNGVFTSTPLFSNEEDEFNIDLGDLDGDEDVDIVAVFNGFFNGKIIEWENKGNNLFSDRPLRSAAISGIENVQVVDIDQDGDNDIAYSSFESAKVLALINKGPNFFTDQNLAQATGAIRNFHIADFNTDGIMDIITGCNSSSCTYHEGLSATGFDYSSEPISEVQAMFFIEHGDFDGDDDLDLIVSNGDFWWLSNELEQQHVSVHTLDEIAYNIYPNPFTDYIVINLSGKEVDMYIADPFGRLLWESSRYTSSINLGFLQKGIYFLTIVDRKSGRIVQTSKMIKI